MVTMTLREVCNLVGVTRRTVQGYEKEELVASTGKNKYGYLLYDEDAVKRIHEIKMYRDFGFSLKDIKVLLASSEEEYLKLMSKRLNDMRMELIKLKANVTRMEELIVNKQD